MAKGGKLSDEILADLGKSRGGGGARDDGDAEDAADDGADEETEGDSYQGDEETVAGDIKSALEGGDNAEIAKALRAFLDVCVPKIVDGMNK